MHNTSWDWTFPEMEKSNQIWKPFQKWQFTRTDKDLSGLTTMNLPETCGQAMEVPLMVLVASGSPIQAEVMSTPGAKMSTQAP